ncbi:phosphatase PAP2 family protein [Geodermatophilus ruber]|uniref:phosphatase PAP2 family protein n=1 Tax=Geodermatophilus ruber TaxID=504800 RepID=UPI000B8935DA|nr:phosphatase PAP2 family protein [Geodermatophilus ruber]
MDVLRGNRALSTRTRALTAVVVALAVLAVLGAGVLVGFGPQARLDDAVSSALYAGDDRSAVLDTLLEVLTAPGAAAFRVLVCLPVVVWLAVRRAWWSAGWVVIAVVTISPLTVLLKEVVGRVRPAFENGGATYESLSYPSGHASGIATLVTVVLILVWPRLTAVRRRGALVAGIALVVLVGLTRIWLGAHFLSDVVGGWALGVGWTMALALAFGALPGGRGVLRGTVTGPAT